MIETMKEIGGGLFFAALFVGVPAWCGWLVADAVRTGVVRAKGFPYSRSDSPIYFWVAVATYAAMAVGVGYFGLLIGMDIWRGR